MEDYEGTRCAEFKRAFEAYGNHAVGNEWDDLTLALF